MAFFCIVVKHSRLSLSTTSNIRLPGTVGTLWSSTAIVASGRWTDRPASRKPAKACGDVISCTRCRSIYKMVDSPGASRTTWASQIFSNMVFGTACFRSIRVSFHGNVKLFIEILYFYYLTLSQTLSKRILVPHILRSFVQGFKIHSDSPSIWRNDEH